MSLQETVQALLAPSKGILAADESVSTAGKRLDSVGLENTLENRLLLREMLLTSPDFGEYISGVILYDEVIRGAARDGRSFVEILTSQGVVPGIKVDMGAKPLAGSEGEMVTEGLDGLRDRLKEYYELGARFAKWRAVVTIDEAHELPTTYSLDVNADALGRYAALCQEAGIVPIVEPEVIMDGSHSIEACYDATKRALQELFDELQTQQVDLSCLLLKPNMVLSGKNASEQASIAQVAEMTVKCFQESVPSEVPGIAFLSGGQSEDSAVAHLNAMNQLEVDKPWELSFSFSRALEHSALVAWDGKDGNLEAAQKAFIAQAKRCSLARDGKL